MAGIWINSGTDEAGWTLGAPRPLPDEKTLHGLIAENPQLLPLAGSPQLTVLGSEVQLGAGYADILAVEPSGRPAIIEVKLAYNQDARSAIVSQILYYAAFLQGLTVENLEQNFAVRGHLETVGHKSILEAVQANDQDGVVDADSFTNSLQGFLDRGDFRLVFLLDDVSSELERIVAYLDAKTTQALPIDLITVRVYDVNGAQVALPQRVSSDLSATASSVAHDPAPRPQGSRPVKTTDGVDAFRSSIASTSGEDRKTFDKLIEWAEKVADLPDVRLVSTVGTANVTLKPMLWTENAGLVTIFNTGQTPSLYAWRGVFERRAPKSLADIEQRTPDKIGQGTWIPTTDEILDALTAAYREATGPPPLSPPQETPA